MHEDEAAAGMGGDNGPGELLAAHKWQAPCAVSEVGQRAEGGKPRAGP